MTQDKYLDYAALAEYTGVGETVLRKYLSVARAARADGEESKSFIPEPDMVIGRSPAWKIQTIDRWLKGRPGKGVGGGPKPRAHTDA